MSKADCDANKVLKLQAEIERLEAEATVMREALEAVMWAELQTGQVYCQWCAVSKDEEHLSDCQGYNALSADVDPAVLEGRFKHFLFDFDVSNWPIDEFGDSLDTENLLLIKVSDAGVEFCCGGDWQDPQRLLLTPDLNVISVDGPTAFPEIEVDEGSLGGLGDWLEARR